MQMTIKKRKVRPRPRPRPAVIDLAVDQAIDRMGAILEAGHGTQKDANVYFHAVATRECNRMRQLSKVAMETRSWDHMIGAYTQAMTLYVYAGKLYEHYPDNMIMPDGAFDKLARWLLVHWDNLSDEFKLWHHITAMGLEAGTAMGLKGDQLIRRMISIHTEIPLEQIDVAITQKPARPVRRKIVIRGKRTKIKPRKPPRKRI
jgi:hypothetical protein